MGSDGRFSTFSLRSENRSIDPMSVSCSREYCPDPTDAFTSLISLFPSFLFERKREMEKEASVRLGHKRLRTLMKRSSLWYLPGGSTNFSSKAARQIPLRLGTSSKFSYRWWRLPGESSVTKETAAGNRRRDVRKLSTTLRFHKDNLRHLSRFPGFFVTKRILSTKESYLPTGITEIRYAQHRILHFCWTGFWLGR